MGGGGGGGGGGIRAEYAKLRYSVVTFSIAPTGLLRFVEQRVAWLAPTRTGMFHGVLGFLRACAGFAG